MNRDNEPGPDEMRPEYDIRGGVRGKYHDRYQQGTNVVLLEPDVAEVFPSAESVNEALRFLIRITKDNKPLLREPGGDA